MSIHEEEYPPCVVLPRGVTEPCKVALEADDHRQKTQIADNLFFLQQRCKMAQDILRAQGFHAELDCQTEDGTAVCPLRLFADLVPNPEDN